MELFRQNDINSAKLQVLGNGLDTKTFFSPKVKVANTYPVVLFTGGMDHRPNIDAVV